MQLNIHQSRKQAKEFMCYKFDNGLIDECEFDYMMYKLNSYSDTDLKDYQVFEEVYGFEKIYQ